MKNRQQQATPGSKFISFALPFVGVLVGGNSVPTYRILGALAGGLVGAIVAVTLVYLFFSGPSN